MTSIPQISNVHHIGQAISTLSSSMTNSTIDTSSSVENTNLLASICLSLATMNDDNTSGAEKKKALDSLSNVLKKYQNIEQNQVSLNKINNEIYKLSTLFNSTSQQTDYATLNIDKNKKIDNILNNIQFAIRNQKLYINQSHAKTSVLLHKEIQKDKSKDDDISVHTSYAELWAVLADAIDKIKQSYVDRYSDLLEKYTEMYSDFNSEVQKAVEDATTAGAKDNTVHFDSDKMKAAYADFMAKVAELEKGLGTLSADEEKSIGDTLKPAFNLSENGDGTYTIKFNLDEFKNMSKTTPDTGDISTPKYQAWLATFNAAGNSIQSNMQSFAQRYSQANSTFDNINKVLSSSISSLADCSKAVIKNLS